VYGPIPSRISVTEVGLAHEPSVRNIDEAVRDRHANLHVFDFIAVFVRPPYACPDAFARRVNPRMAGGIFSKGEASEPAGLHG